MRKFIQVAGLLIALPLLMAALGCDTNPITGGAETPQQKVFAFTERYKIAVSLANQYEDLKRCKPDDPPATVCSDRSVVAMIRKIDKAVFAIMQESQIIVRDPAASESLIKAAIANAAGAAGRFTGVVAELQLK